MHEQGTTTPESIEISNSPESFRTLVEEAAKKFGLEMFGVNFDAEASRTEDADGTQHITIKPVLLTKVTGFSRDVDSLFALKGESLAYAVRIKSWGGNIYNDGDQTLYTSIELFKLWTGAAPENLKNANWSGISPQVSSHRLYFHHEENWVAGAHTDFVESEESSLRIATTEDDPLFKEILSHVVSRPPLTMGSTI